MESEVKQIAATLRSTEKMAERFAQRVQERVGYKIPYATILDEMQSISPKSLTMGKLVARIKRQHTKR